MDTSPLDDGDLIFSKKEMYELLEAGKIVPLSDEFMMPDIVALIRKFEQEIDYYKSFKKNRAVPIDEAIEKNEKRIEFFKSVIVATMEKLNATSRKFPGVCRLNIQPKKATWKVLDPTKLLEVLKAENEYDRVVETKPVVKKDELNELLDTWQKIGKVPDCVQRENADMRILKITSLDKPKDDVPVTDGIPLSQNDMDALDTGNDPQKAS